MLLCFVLHGLSTAYVIPVGYIFTRNLKYDRLRSLTFNVLKAFEEAGFFIVCIVTDNHQTSTAMFRGTSDDNTMQHVVPHPVRENDPLFLSFDPNHLVKNLRTNLLEREMFDGTEKIRGGFFLKALYEIQQNLLVKSARLLSRFHVEPYNLEKMKVSRATLAFSPAVISSLEFLQKNSKAHERASEFRDCGSAITFMKTVGKWYNLHDISCWKSRQRPFVTSEDDRLAWLEVDFIGYLEDIKMESAKCQARSLPKETYEATIMTRSTVAAVEYLLNDVGQVY
uniref:Putative tick transposon n=1 Tax=Rhipicephalus pulchellus TaxID=72859 RepID=L7LY83_RHIPC